MKIIAQRFTEEVLQCPGSEAFKFRQPLAEASEDFISPLGECRESGFVILAEVEGTLLVPSKIPGGLIFKRPERVIEYIMAWVKEITLNDDSNRPIDIHVNLV